MIQHKISHPVLRNNWSHDMLENYFKGNLIIKLKRKTTTKSIHFQNPIEKNRIKRQNRYP